MTCQLCGYEFIEGDNVTDIDKMKDIILHYRINHSASEMLYDFYLRLR